MYPLKVSILIAICLWLSVIACELPDTDDYNHHHDHDNKTDHSHEEKSGDEGVEVVDEDEDYEDEGPLDLFCEPTTLDEQSIDQIEECFKIPVIDLKDHNPFKACKSILFANLESNEEIRGNICSDESIFYDFETCMEESIWNQTAIIEIGKQKMECIKKVILSDEA